MAKTLWSVLAISLAFACDSPFESEPESRLGTLLDIGDGLEIDVPDTAGVGESFDIEVRTQGNGCVSFGGTEVEVEGRTVDFRPFDLDSSINSGFACTEILNVIEHRASVQFDQAGPVTVRIHGMVFSSGGVLRETVIERIVEVR